LLFILIGLKILSGYSLTSKISGISWLPGLHQNRTLDLLLLLLFTFHAFYGLRLFLIDLGMMRRERLLLWISTFAGMGLFGLAYFFFF
jgi:succinate dehydrogenase/fumarate reductase cytochrome b subunit